MKLSNLDTFVSLVETASFAETARQLGLSVAAVSKQIARLEQETGVLLFDRTTRRVKSTDSGKLLYHQAKKILEEIEEAKSLISAIHTEPQGRLKIFANPHFAQIYILPNLAQFMNQYPKINIELELAERIPDMEREGVDLLLGMSQSASGPIIQRRILTTRYVLCASPSYLAKMGTPEKSGDLLNHRYLNHSMRHPSDEIILNKGEVISVQPYLTVNDTKSLLQLAIDGLGIVMLHEYVVEKSIKNGLLVEVLPHKTLRDVPLWVTYRESRLVPSKIRYFIDYITSHVTP